MLHLSLNFRCFLPWLFNRLGNPLDPAASIEGHPCSRRIGTWSPRAGVLASSKSPGTPRRGTFGTLPAWAYRQSDKYCCSCAICQCFHSACKTEEKSIRFSHSHVARCNNQFTCSWRPHKWLKCRFACRGEFCRWAWWSSRWSDRALGKWTWCNRSACRCDGHWDFSV